MTNRITLQAANAQVAVHSAQLTISPILLCLTASRELLNADQAPERFASAHSIGLALDPWRERDRADSRSVLKFQFPRSKEDAKTSH